MRKEKRLFEECFKLPIRQDSFGSHIWDSNDNICAQFLDVEDNKERDYILDIINGKQVNNDDISYELIDDKTWGFTIMSGDRKIILMRGWGFLTGTGGLKLSSERAVEIQEDLANYFVDKLNGK